MNYRSTKTSLLLQTICYLQLTVTIMDHTESKETKALSISKKLGSSYLNQQRPLWILEDQVQQNDYTELNYSTEPQYSFHMQQKQMQKQQKIEQYSSPQLRQSRQQSRETQRPPHAQHLRHQRPRQPLQRDRTYKFTPRLRLPQYFQPLRRVHFQRRLTHKQPRFTNPKQLACAHRREQYIPHFSLPTFDSVPGDESLDAAPIFIYTGPKGAIILNTMLSAPTYPMQEPVPGQVLHPPNVPIFRPKPIVERFRMPGSTQVLNLTLMPFYAHEAIDMPQVSRMSQQDVGLSQEATTVQPTVVYEAPAVMTSSFSASGGTEYAAPKKKWRTKKAKYYSAYHSPNEVQWTPLTFDQLSFRTATTTPFPLTAPSPPQNHRFTTDMLPSSTTPASHDDYKITYKSDVDSAENALDRDDSSHADNRLGVIYVDDSLEKPTTSSESPPKVSSRYSLSKEYYAFPVFTLSKLLRKEAVDTTEKQLSTALVENTADQPLVHEQVQQVEHVTQSAVHSDSVAEENGDTGANDEETWFILNSRYKGQRSQKNNEYRLSSKYIHTTDPREPNEINS